MSTEEAVEIAERCYGLRVEAQRLSGEKDSNFHLIDRQGREFLLKVVNPEEDPAATNMQTAALQHVEKTDPGMPVQRVVPNLAGSPEFTLDRGPDDARTVRLVTFTRGLLQRKTPQTPAQRHNIGAMLARLQSALEDFRHPAESHSSIWDLKNILSLDEMFEDIKDGMRRTELLGWVDLFRAEVLPNVSHLRAQVVHNDLNSDNVVVDPVDTDKIIGIIDFGDMVRTPVVFDVAVAAAYQLTETENPLADACDFLRGFHSRRPLLPTEIDILFPTIVARMVMRIAITEWRAVRFPENRKYILRNTPLAWRQFHRLAQIPRAQATSQIAHALSL
ncbi:MULTISPECIES: phosphotransferase [unclassified Mesorhizobium]|uniref:phosphotransferase n=1 Tax=unclassified Mesorhizobium TaxID=325217 RepID=UPI002415848E|nr:MULTISPECIES: phosphotransferase [unclassified Mesorhizobium]MDG4889955.1 phosphotransferase [Mesorhizobium sp. WSM4887]MDG4904098.1 phosphotransferase [Mesorhizobium sp. WSM4962]MDG4909125.1 phosphotransferase [Mesorhizobium sp. WSM4898]MDG4921749.1 phosphotransferase [Mesorhizobium sp. WSM4989]